MPSAGTLRLWFTLALHHLLPVELHHLLPVELHHLLPVELHHCSTFPNSRRFFPVVIRCRI